MLALVNCYSNGLVSYPTHVLRLADPDKDDPDCYNAPYNNRKAEPAVLSPPQRSHESSLDADEPAYINHSNAYLQQAPGTTEAGSKSRRPVRTEAEEADLDGLERALRAPERSAAGGLAYYINLEDHHFRGFPGYHQSKGGARSADDLGTT